MFNLLKYGDKIAVIDDRENILTYRQLAKEADQLALNYKGGIVFMLCENVIGSLVGYVSCMYKNIPSVLLDGNKDSEQLQQLIDVYQPEYIWLPKKRSHEFCEKINGAELIYEYETYALVLTSYRIKNVNPLLQLCLPTSGSTGSPKFVRISERNLESNTVSIAEYLHITDKERPIISMPMFYSYGMSVINSHLICGATVLLTDKSIMQREFWNFLKEQRATSIAGVPYTYEMLMRLHFFSMNLPDLRTMTQAGGKLNATFVKEYVDYAEQRGKEFIVMYGQTEASPRMSYLPAEKAKEKAGSIGIPIPGGEMKVTDAAGKEITEPHTEGELVYRGENVCLGYAETREDLQKGDENFGELHTGDVAKFDEDGYFYITGRLNRFVKIWGNRTNLDAIEQFVKSITADCACSGADDLITVFVTQDGLEEAIKNLLVEKTGFHPKAFRVRKINSIPLKSNGKIDYPVLKTML